MSEEKEKTYTVLFNGRIRTIAKNKKEAKENAETEILYSLDDVLYLHKKDFLKIKIK